MNRTRIRWAMKCPSYFLLRLVAGPGSSAEIRFHQRRSRAGLSRMLGVPVSTVDGWFREVELSDNLRAVEEKIRSLPYAGIFRGGPELYVILRSIRPKTVVETGVGLGFSSAYILEALNQNEGGRLVSVDLPNADRSWSLPSGTRPGFLVPESLLGRWQLRLGNTRELLPMVFKDLGLVDVFFHDSEHTYETMMFEYIRAFESLSPQGTIISDDSMWNTAMLDFARDVHRKIEFVYHRGGSAPFTLIRKDVTAPGSTRMIALCHHRTRRMS